MKSKIVCILVLYRPDVQVYRTIINLIKNKYDVVVVVNSAAPSLLRKISILKNTYIINNKANLGLATSLNLGANFSFVKLKAKYIIFFDQDSSPSSDLPLQLCNELRSYYDHRTVCIGPKILDVKMHVKSKVSQRIIRTKAPLLLPTSGCMISSNGWRSVGPMMDELFIDCIDHEWCFRANINGYKVVRSNRYYMAHNLGDMVFDFFDFKKCFHRLPIRHYFIIRNSIYLLLIDNIPMKWKFIEIFKLIRRIPIYITLSDNPLKSAILIIRGINDGFKRRLGPISIRYF